jgi:hydrogenase expression/formation protein HypC
VGSRTFRESLTPGYQRVLSSESIKAANIREAYFMCLGIPGKIVELHEQNDLPMGKVEFGGILKEVCLAYTPEAQVGDYVLVHVGFAISRIDETEAQETLDLLNQLAECVPDQ